MQIISGIPNEIFSLSLALCGSIIYFFYSLIKSGTITLLKSLIQCIFNNNNNVYNDERNQNPENRNNNQNSENECSICLNRVNLEIVTSCNHFFCGKILKAKKYIIIYYIYKKKRKRN
jgi:hypothetical protein